MDGCWSIRGLEILFLEVGPLGRIDLLNGGERGGGGADLRLGGLYFKAEWL